MASIRRNSALADRIGDDQAADFRRGSIRLREKRLAGLISVQVPEPAPDASRLLDQRLGLSLPTDPNTAAGDRPCCLWTAPGEWLVVTETGREHGLAVQITGILSGQLAAVTVVSDSRTIIEVSGDGVRDLLAKGCGLDLHPRAFTAGRCAHTRFAQVAVLVHQTGNDAFDLYAGRPVARTLWEWLVDASREFGPPPD